MAAVLLTGATGYLGSRVVAALGVAGIPFQVLPGRLEDIRPASLRGLDAVIHCAGALRRRESSLESANTEGTRYLLEGLSPHTRVIFVSSRSVYAGNGHEPVDERAPTEPGDAYGASKLSAERAIRASGRECVIFRASGLFGHPERAGIFLDHAVDAALAGGSVTLATPDRREDYLDVEVMARLMVAALAEGPHWGRVLNAAGPMRSLAGTVADLAGAIESLCGRRLDVSRRAIPLPAYPLLAIDSLQLAFPAIRQASDREIFTRMLKARLAASRTA
jgi:nucleoside-diphosphate-sugar epimerase